MDLKTPISTTNTDEWITTIQSTTSYWGPEIDRTLSVVLQSMAESSEPRDGTDLVNVLTDDQQRRAFADDHEVTAENLEMVGKRVAKALA